MIVFKIVQHRNNRCYHVFTLYNICPETVDHIYWGVNIAPVSLNITQISLNSPQVGLFTVSSRY